MWISVIASLVLGAVASATPIAKTVQVVGGDGEESDYGDHPYICSLQLLHYGVWYHICGAVIYNERTLVTAGHCVNNYQTTKLRARCGEYHLYDDDDYEQTQLVEQTVVHPDYEVASARGFPSDLATLKLAQPLIFHSMVKAFPFDDGSKDWNRPNCKFSGWGKNATGYLRLMLRDVNIRRVENQDCSDMWGSAKINDGHACFYDPKTDESSCNGDSGGPIRCGNTIYGITSWGNRECDGSMPSVYTRVSYFYTWIVHNSF